MQGNYNKEEVWLTKESEQSGHPPWINRHGLILSLPSVSNVVEL